MVLANRLRAESVPAFRGASGTHNPESLSRIFGRSPADVCGRRAKGSDAASLVAAFRPPLISTSYERADCFP